VVTTNDSDLSRCLRCRGTGFAQEVTSMPGVYQLSVDKIVEEAKEVHDLGIPAIILFGIPDTKDDRRDRALGTTAASCKKPPRR
jgi:porphobilinogen synthase